MKKQAKYVTLIVSMSVLFITACKKDHTIVSPTPGTPTPTGNDEKLAKVEQSNGAYTSFDYNASGQVATLSAKQTGSAVEILALSYNADKKIDAATTTDGKMKFVYDSNKSLTRLEFWSTQNQHDTLRAYTNYIFQNGKLAESKMFIKFDPADIPAERITYTYNASGDVTTQQTYEWSILLNNYALKETATFEYDSKKNPLSATFELGQALLESISVHNPVKRTVTDAQNNVTETDTFTYSYDSKGYPATQTEKIVKPNNADVSIQSTFSYK
ncbi:MAG TPA: hypothetical protein VL442_03040 [Mucilaginibacter sp.]|jgi:hypothetical protein|nr:hypothetical protein [Mucilaginibacter sp.]